MTNYTGLTQKDLELIERVIYKNGDDIAVSIARSFERLEDRIDATESRLYSRIAEVEDKVEGNREAIADFIGEIRTDIHEMTNSREESPSAE
jgi:hypothetical protein